MLAWNQSLRDLTSEPHAKDIGFKRRSTVFHWLEELTYTQNTHNFMNIPQSE